MECPHVLAGAIACLRCRRADQMLVMERPKAFSKMFCAALLTPPKNRRALARSKELLCDRGHT